MQIHVHTVRIVQRHKSLSGKHIFSISKEGRIMPPAYVNIISPNIKTKENIDSVMASYISLQLLSGMHILTLYKGNAI